MRRLTSGIAAAGFLLISSGLATAGSSSITKPLWIKKGTVQDVLGIPDTMADVKGGYFPPGQRLLNYVLIEDVHTLPEAQGKIAAILLYGHHHWGSRRAYVEGAFGPIGPPPFPIFTAERGERGVNELLRHGLFSGGELAAALTSLSPADEKGPFEVIGMDDPALYQKQLEVMEELCRLQDQALRRLQRLSILLGPRDTERLRRLLELRMSPADFTQDRRLLPAGMSDPLLIHAIQLANAYYELTDLRSRHFAQRTQARVGRGPCLLVIGGYHTPLLARILRDRGESFVVLSPRLTQNDNRLRYQKSLLKSLDALRQFPSHSLYASPVGFLRMTRACLPDRQAYLPAGKARKQPSSATD